VWVAFQAACRLRKPVSPGRGCSVAPEPVRCCQSDPVPPVLAALFVSLEHAAVATPKRDEDPESISPETAHDDAMAIRRDMLYCHEVTEPAAFRCSNARIEEESWSA